MPRPWAARWRRPTRRPGSPVQCRLGGRRNQARARAGVRLGAAPPCPFWPRCPMRRQMDENADGRRWWHGAVLYQLYVRSWLDTDGDGYGDLNGVIARLDYPAWLGADRIWLSPTMPSPDQDWGYDVSDYRNVHPELGTLDDLDRLVAEAGARGLRVLLDLVPNHSSTAHPWFVDAAGGRESAHRDYYVWADPAADRAPPHDRRAATGHPRSAPPEPR